MEVITHRSKQALYNVAKELNIEVYDGPISYCFYVYNEGEIGKRNAKEFHQFLK
jgi:hypothetical protein